MPTPFKKNVSTISIDIVIVFLPSFLNIKFNCIIFLLKSMLSTLLDSILLNEE